MFDPNMKPNRQFLLLQSQAYHEDKLLHIKPTVDNKWKKNSNYINGYDIPSKKNYLNREKHKEIENGNLRLLSRIYNIIFDKSKDKKELNASMSKEDSKENYHKPTFHPYSDNNKIRSLNITSRRKESARINQDNFLLLNRIKESKPTVTTIDEIKSREKRAQSLPRKKKKPSKIPHCVLPSITNRIPLNPVLEQYLKRHDMLPTNHTIELPTELSTLDKKKRSKSSKRNQSFQFSTIGNNKRDVILDVLREKRTLKKQSNLTEMSNSQIHETSLEKMNRTELITNISMEKLSVRASQEENINQKNYKSYFASDMVEEEMKKIETSYIQDSAKDI